MKTCTKCKLTQPFECFSKNKQTKDGLHNWCKTCYCEYMKVFYGRNKKAIKQRSRAYFEAHRDEQNAKRRKRRQDNLEAERENSRKWAAQNRDKTRAYKSKNRAKRLNLKQTGHVITSDIQKLLRSPSCFYCNAVEKLTLDHVVPLARGGSHTIGNLVAACGNCNSSKGSKLLIEWRLYRNRLDW